MRTTILFVLATLLSSAGAWAQVRGRVIEINGNDTLGVPGAVLNWKNTAVAVSTDAEGRFSLPRSAGQNTLLITSVGYEKREVAIRDSSVFLWIRLKSSSLLNEIEVVYYTSGTEISYLNPIKTEILNERSLMKAACCNLSESFETNPSIDVNFTDAVSGTRQIQMLGLAGQYAQITKENMPYLRGIANNYGLSFVPGTWIQSIQLGKGAGSVINGYESFTGQINTELQNPAKSDRLNFNAYVNENARNEYNLNLRQKLNQNLSTGLLSHMSFNPLVQDLNGDGFADIPTGSQINFMNKYTYSNPKTGFEAQFGGAYLKDQRQGGQFQETVKPLNDSIPLYKIGIHNEKWELYSKTGYIFKKRPATSMGLQLSYLDHDQLGDYGLRHYQGAQKTFYANGIFETYLNSTINTIKGGVSYMNDQVAERMDSLRFSRLESVAGLFTEYAYNRGEKLNLVLGLRADYHNLYGLFCTPRVHFRYAFNPRSVFRLSAGRALRTASLFTDNASYLASSRAWRIEPGDAKLPYGLKPETAWNYGMNFTQKFKLNYRDAYVTLDVYRTEFINQVVVDVDQSPREVHFYNLNGPSYSNTMQFEFNVEPKKRFFFKTAYRYVDTKVSFKSGLMQKAMVSMHRAFVNLSYETRNKHWQLDFTTQWNGPKRLPGTQSNPQEYRRADYSPAYFNLLGQITYLQKIKGHDLHVYLGVENLLNYKQHDPIVASDKPFGPYFDASMVWGPVYGRMLYAGMRFKIKA
ncbi:MAG TPA: carboxypeptidase-like regulatory domain-containing protein [Bacteroidia bacterium]|nr:carboxypeptidase-like regulatory domain-containing protein [Bacteroidia bacterium]